MGTADIWLFTSGLTCIWNDFQIVALAVWPYFVGLSVVCTILSVFAPIFVRKSRMFAKRILFGRLKPFKGACKRKCGIAGGIAISFIASLAAASLSYSVAAVHDWFFRNVAPEMSNSHMPHSETDKSTSFQYPLSINFYPSITLAEPKVFSEIEVQSAMVYVFSNSSHQQQHRQLKFSMKGDAMVGGYAAFAGE